MLVASLMQTAFVLLNADIIAVSFWVCKVGWILFGQGEQLVVYSRCMALRYCMRYHAAESARIISICTNAYSP